VPDHLDINAHAVNLSRGAPSFSHRRWPRCSKDDVAGLVPDARFAQLIAKFDLMLVIGRAKEGRATTTSVVAANTSLKA
jgi:hypothetical protein